MDFPQATTLRQKRLLDRYVETIMDASHWLGLTAAKDVKEFRRRHVADALKLLELVPNELRQKPINALDVGSGNGIPGIPIAILQSNWRVFLLDSNNKKCGFLDMFIKYNRIENCSVMVGRAEQLAHNEAYREQFDLVFSRALGSLPVVLELCTPFLMIGGTLIVPHGTSYNANLEASRKAMCELGVSLKDAITYKLDASAQFIALFFIKDRKTPDRYPRKSGIPKKRPL